MSLKVLSIFLLIVVFLFPFSALADTEVSYPVIPGAISPQDIVQQAESEEEVFPLFLAYIFNVLLFVSVAVIAGITIYVISVYATSSANPERKKKAKEWMINVLQGSLIIFTSYTILYALDSRLVLFQSRNLDDTDRPEEVSMEWDLKTKYFQIPTGLLIEDAILNDIAQNKFYDILGITENAEGDLDKIIPIGQEIINIIEMCPVGRNCCGEILLANVEEMIENYPHREGGASSWQEIYEIIEEDEEFFEKYVEAFNKITGKTITKEGIKRMAYLEELGYDFRQMQPAGTDVISSGIDEHGEIFDFYGKTEEEIETLIYIDFKDEESFQDFINELDELASLNKVASSSLYIARRQPTQEELRRWKEQGHTTLHTTANCINPFGDAGDTPIDDYIPGEEPEEEDETEEKECPPCLLINPMIMKRIEEMQPHLSSFSNNLNLLYESKKPLHEDLYQIYKIVMLKSLGYENIINYPTLLFEKRIYDFENIVITTDTEKTNISNYTWSWEQWINNIIYKIQLNGEVITENDPVTFYLKETLTKKIIEDALLMAKKGKEKGFQNIDKVFSLEKEEVEENNISFLEKTINFIKDIFRIKDKIIVFAESPEEKLKKCIEEKEINVEEIDFLKLLDLCEIDYDDDDTLLLSRLQDPSKFLSCGMEIPVGETMELTWNHLIKILNTIDNYIETGELFLEKQEHMNSLASQCECPCGNDSCPVECGNCELTCNLGEIIAVYNEILEIRAMLKEIADEIRLLTYGHFNTPTEDVCNALNEDIRDENEKELCLLGENKLINKHELITRKLNYSRYAFDSCITLPEDIDDIYEGRKIPKLPVFAPIAEKKNLPRYTKTKENGELINTSNFNWFCCEGL